MTLADVIYWVGVGATGMLVLVVVIMLWALLKR